MMIGRHIIGNVAHDGSADEDADRHNDYEEFLAGSDPLDPASVLRLEAGSRHLLPGTNIVLEVKWTSAPGLSYRLQDTTRLGSPWSDMGDFLTDGPNAVAYSPGQGFCGSSSSSEPYCF